MGIGDFKKKIQDAAKAATAPKAPSGRPAARPSLDDSDSEVTVIDAELQARIRAQLAAEAAEESEEEAPEEEQEEAAEEEEGEEAYEDEPEEDEEAAEPEDEDELSAADRAKEAKLRERDARIAAAMAGPTSHKFSDQDKTPQGQKAIAQGIENKRRAGSYDYTRSAGADFDWPDFDPESIGELEPWLCYTADGKGGWVDLNAIASGKDRRATAAYRMLGITKAEALQRVDEKSSKLLDKLLSLPDAELAKQAPSYDLKKSSRYTYRDYLNGLKLEFADLTRRANAQAQRGLDEANRMMKEEMDGNISAAKKGGLLDPIQGVTMEDWAGANAKIASGTGLPEILKVLGIEKPVWDTVSAEWMARMSRDTTFAISTVYGQAFTNPNIGKFAPKAGGAKAAAPKSSGAATKVMNDFELYVKVMTHQNVGASQGLDAQGILAKYGLTVVDWSNIGAHWSAKLMSDFTLATKMGDLMNKYTAEFSKPGAGDDIEF